MRRSRRNGHAAHEFGGSGEDSFVAVVVTKLTGALLFILLLTMVIMALLPKAIDLPASGSKAEKADSVPLAIATPESLPEAIAGRPYTVALAATGGQGLFRWSVDGKLPEGIAFDPDKGQLHGTPRRGTAEAVSLVLRVSDGSDRAAKSAHLLVYESEHPLSTPSKWAPGLPPIPWRTWMEHGVGFLFLWLVHSVCMSSLRSIERRALAGVEQVEDEVEAAQSVIRRFLAYKTLVRLTALGTAVALAVWLQQQRG